MHTPAQLKAMTGAERLALMAQLAATRYGTEQFAALLADDLDMNKRTWFSWKERGDVPITAVAAMEGWVNAPDHQERLRADFSEVTAQLSDIVKAAGVTASVLGRISRRISVAPAGPEQSDGAALADAS